jgi:anti-sigma B factor antagonist
MARSSDYTGYIFCHRAAQLCEKVVCGLRGRSTRATLSFVDLKEAPVQLELSTRNLDGIAVVDCHGRLIFGEESASLRDALRNLLAINNQIVLNLGGVNYIDSGGLGTLVALYTTARNAGGSIKLAALTQRVGDLLQVTKLLTVFEVFDTVEDAVGSYRKGAAA